MLWVNTSWIHESWIHASWIHASHYGYMHHGYMHHGYMYHGYIHHGYMNHGYMHHGYKHHGHNMHHRRICLGHTAWAPEGREGRSQGGPKGRRLEVGAPWTSSKNYNSINTFVTLYPMFLLTNQSSDSHWESPSCLKWLQHYVAHHPPCLQQTEWRSTWHLLFLAALLWLPLSILRTPQKNHPGWSQDSVVRLNREMCE